MSSVHHLPSPVREPILATEEDVRFGVATGAATKLLPWALEFLPPLEADEEAVESSLERCERCGLMGRSMARCEVAGDAGRQFMLMCVHCIDELDELQFGHSVPLNTTTAPGAFTRPVWN